MLVGFVVAASGCGTTFNTLGPRQYPHAFGGVEYDCKAMQGTWSNESSPVAEKVLLTGLIAVDFPLCIVGDTLTLPSVVLQSGFQNSSWDFGKMKGQAGSSIYPATGSD